MTLSDSPMRLRHIACAAVLASSLIAAGCGGGGSSGETSATNAAAVAEAPFVNSPESGVAVVDDLPVPKREDLTIGLVAPVLATEIVSDIFDSAKANVEELGGTAIVHDAKLNPDAQVTQLQELINQDVDAIAFVPIASPDLLRPVLAQAAEKEIPVIGMDALPGAVGPLPGFASEIWQRRDFEVYLQAKAAAEELGPGAKVGQIGLIAPVPLFEFSEPRTAFWAKKFGLDVVAKAESPTDSVEGGQQAATELLAQHPEIEGIIGYNDEPAIGAALAARAAGRDDVKTFGINAGSLGISSIETGRLTASVHFDGAEYGRVTAIVTYDAAQGAKLPPEILAGEPVIVTEDNVSDVRG